ncbi:hypothetical protein LK464_14985 [Mycobacteroides abscessus subsp. abscessus]|uniref:hypothetical protein n=1 Tax=Mycobacteroides abscessus TaxID=36809 RepID=UPI00189699A4|nr:hypothetical protein [Mycobacteroides abscessus]UEA22787.1 hypothetical protein LK464_14985 [Mycobacteroides abscessus subsp. abscessus]
MTLKRIGAAVGVAAVLAAFPLTMLGTEYSTGAGIPVAAAAPTTLYPGDPGYDDARQWERDLPSYTPPATRTVTVTPTTTTTKPAPATKNEGGSGFPWWVWVLGTLGVIGGLLWWGTTLDDGSSARAALRTADDDDDDDEDDEDDDEDVLTYPAITPSAEPIPYPEPTPSVPVQPAPSTSTSLMDRLGGK